MSNQIQLTKHLREVGAAIEARKLSVSEAVNLADGLLRDAKDQRAFEGNFLERIVGSSPNIITAASWVDDQVRNELGAVGETGDPDDVEAVQRHAIIQGCAKIADLIIRRDGKNTKQMRTAISKRETWLERPFDPDCQERVPKNEPTIDAVRAVVPHWDTENLSAVLTGLRMLYTEEQIKGMTFHDIQMYYVMNNRRLLKLMGGAVNTTDGTFFDVDFSDPDDRRFVVKTGTREAEVLQVLFEAEAFDIRNRMTIKEIAPKASKDTTANDYKKPVANLEGKRLVSTQRGDRGGCWLTDKGQDEAQHLIKV